MNYGKIASGLLSSVREKKPLLHHITNHVVMNDNANVSISIGASPVMAHAHGEAEEFGSIAEALIINIGTLDDYWIKSMKLAARGASKKNVPIILDPVGAGATKLRTDTVMKLLGDFPVRVVKGNAGEICALAGIKGLVRGVDSEQADPVGAAVSVAKRFRTVVAATGKNDFITDGTRILCVENHSQWLSTITGSGCSANPVVAAYVSVGSDVLESTACAIASYCVAAEIAQEGKINGPASFKTAFFDAIYSLSPKELEERVKIREINA